MKAAESEHSSKMIDEPGLGSHARQPANLDPLSELVSCVTSASSHSTFSCAQHEPPAATHDSSQLPS